MNRSIEAILREAQEVQQVMNRASYLMDSCNARMGELKQELELRDASDTTVKVVLDGMAYEFADAEAAHEALSAAADNWETEEDDGVYGLEEEAK